MVLVLGRPGSGCSTLLRVIANMRESFIKVKGDVTYGGISASEFSRYRFFDISEFIF
jgi:ABC-type multidrug transport system ATPase subunit